jgi:hypothetical protein
MFYQIRLGLRTLSDVSIKFIMDQQPLVQLAWTHLSLLPWHEQGHIISQCHNISSLGTLCQVTSLVSLGPHVYLVSLGPHVQTQVQV